LKDDELLEQRVAEGRFTGEQVVRIRAEGAKVAAALERGERWWDGAWADWTPNGSWSLPAFPPGYLQP
jgi:hypothetical protein